MKDQKHGKGFEINKTARNFIVFGIKTVRYKTDH